MELICLAAVAIGGVAAVGTALWRTAHGACIGLGLTAAAVAVIAAFHDLASAAAVLLVHAAIGMAVAPAQLRWSATTRPGRRRVPATVGIVVGLVLVVAMTRPGSEDVALEAGSLGADALTLIVAVLALLGAGVGISALARRGST